MKSRVLITIMLGSVCNLYAQLDARQEIPRTTVVSNANGQLRVVTNDVNRMRTPVDVRHLVGSLFPRGEYADVSVYSTRNGKFQAREKLRRAKDLAENPELRAALELWESTLEIQILEDMLDVGQRRAAAKDLLDRMASLSDQNRVTMPW